MGSSIQIQLLGSSFSIQTDQAPEYMQRVLGYLQNRIHEIEKTVSTKDPLRISLLASLLIVDELFQLREKLDHDGSQAPYSEELEQMADEMIRRIDGALDIR